MLALEKDINQQLIETLQKTFQFREFRPGQLEALTTLMTHGRLLCIQPTGHGKSLLYQLPSVLLDGLTLVISPLLALMRDQLAQLKSRFGISAASINTDQSEEENSAARYAAQTGEVRILFIAPEQLDHIDRFNFLLELPIKLLVVDEAHCISTWGHDFRPSYRQIIKLAIALVKKNPDIKLLGLTATANNKTEADIKQQLTVDDQEIIVHRESMNRPNIRLSVIQSSGMANKFATMIPLLKELKGSGLIYCATRDNTELVAEYLTGQGIKAVAYHAGMESYQKLRIQNDFIHDKCPIIAATNALGMGIDKANLRFIIHFDFPGSITAYYQEVGRCGRDGLSAEGILLYDPDDNNIQKYFIEASQPSSADFKSVLNVITTEKSPLNLTTLKRLTGLHPTRLIVVVAELVEQEFLQKVSLRGSQVYKLTRKSSSPDLTRYDEQLAVRSAELGTMRRYAENPQKCLMAFLREALGDHIVESCGQCSECTDLSFKQSPNQDLSSMVSSWLNKRPVPITLNKKIKEVSPGVAILDSKMRSPDFVGFMRERAKSNVTDLGVADNLMQLIKANLKDLTHQHKLGCIIPIPSQTWGARDPLINLLADYLNIPALLKLLAWRERPLARQGELLNNDQRQHNVAYRMQAMPDKKIPKGPILLLDDYTGSGATLNEAARALRESAQIKNTIIPFTIAAVKWRLGRRGMI